MDSDLSTSLAMARSASARFSAQVAIVKTNHEADLRLVEMVAEAAKATLPAGQGARVDKTA